MESGQSEIAWAQESVRSSERSPAEQRKAAPLGGHSPYNETEKGGSRDWVSGNHLV